jgi:hypothetical protein
MVPAWIGAITTGLLVEIPHFHAPMRSPSCSLTAAWIANAVSMFEGRQDSGRRGPCSPVLRRAARRVAAAVTEEEKGGMDFVKVYVLLVEELRRFPRKNLPLRGCRRDAMQGAQSASAAQGEVFHGDRLSHCKMMCRAQSGLLHQQRFIQCSRL